MIILTAKVNYATMRKSIFRLFIFHYLIGKGVFYHAENFKQSG